MAEDHTKGPWRVAQTGNHQRLVVSDTTGANVAVVYEAKDAPVLAAAPRLLTALEALTGMAESFPSELHSGHPDVREARAAIEEAKGE